MLGLVKYQKKEIAIYGLGITGISAAKVFKKLNSKVYCWDDNPKIRKKAKHLRLNVSKFWLNKKIIDNIVISPGIDIKKCKIKKYLEKNLNKIITDLDIFFEFNKKALIISITGTNGKSTTCKLIEKILKKSKHKVKTIGNIGEPVLSENNGKYKIFILEVSSYQLQYSKTFCSNHAAIINISPDHLERHKSMKNYAKTKLKIFMGQDKSGFSYINFNSKYSNSFKKIHRQKKLNSKLVIVKKTDCKSLIGSIKNSYFNSAGNLENLSFAFRIAKNLKIKNETIINAVNTFKSLPHRQEIFFSSKSLVCVNDSKATSFEATLQSLKNFNKIYWIVGGLPKKKNSFYLKNVKKKIVKAYIIGKKPLFFKNQIKNSVPYNISKNINNAINNIYKDINFSKKQKVTILLSPAAASYDQFSNFVKRGDYFKNLILKKIKKKSYV